MSNPTNPAFTGPGTQPVEEDGSVLEYMEMPEGMMTFARPIIPEPEETEGLDAAKAILEQVLTALRGFRPGDDAARVDLRTLDPANLAFVDQVLGSGEVSIVAGSDVQIQESVMAASGACGAPAATAAWSRIRWKSAMFRRAWRLSQPGTPSRWCRPPPPSRRRVCRARPPC